MPVRPRVRELQISALAGFCALYACALSAPLLEDFEDGDHDFTLSLTSSHTIGGGVSDSSWSIQNVTGNKVLRSHVFLHTLADDSASLVITGQHFSAPNVAGGNFRYSVDVDVSELIAKANDPTVPDLSVTVALGVLGSGAFSPGSFAGFAHANDGQHYYLAVYTLRLGGDEIDPWASDTEGKLHLFEHGGDGQVDSEASKSLKGAAGAFTFSIEGTYSGGSLTLSADVSSGGGKVMVTDTDDTPLDGAYFGIRSAAYSRAGTNPAADVTFDVDYDNVAIEKDYQPDASIAKGNSNNFKGEGTINTSGKGQQAKLSVDAGDTANCTIRVENRGTQTDDIKVTGAGSVAGFNVTYLDGNTNVTSQVVGSGYTLPGIAPGQGKNLKMRVQTTGGTSGSKQFKVNARSTGDSGARDTVKAKVTIK
ncbi:MAG: hypothetical protein HUU46_10860 [Candidatus Hydrogenedentes bacterium]|nr:hypothetical protein [Candidatus Hydrogenedentota bacterium]